jgi:TolB-like protein/Tfp pilus assembly protein PilF
VQVAAIVILTLIIAAFVAYQIESKRSKQPTIRSLAVLPLQNLSGDPAQQYLVDGMTEELIGRLAGIHDLRVISRTSVMRFKNTQLSVPEIARILGVDAVVEGSVMREGSRIRVHAQLIRAASDEHFWSVSYDRELRDVLAMDADVAQAVAHKVEVTITGEEHQRLAAVRPVLPEVYENYLKGKFALDKANNKSNIDESIAYFNEAIRKDPTYAPSYLGLATAYTSLTTVFMGGVAEQERPRAVLAARKALELDAGLADAHVLMASIAESQWHWAEAESEYHYALDLRPNDAAAYSGLAWWLDCQGRTEEAVAMRRRARELDPLAVSGAGLGWDLFFARHYDQAEQELRSVLALSADNANALWILGFVLIANHHPKDAVRALEKGVSISNRSPALVGLLINAYAQADRRRDALRLLEELKRHKQTAYVPAAAFIFAYLGLGENEQAFVWLEQAYKEQSNVLQTLKVLPFFDPIRSDPRFVDLLRRVGLDRPS